MNANGQNSENFYPSRVSVELLTIVIVFATPVFYALGRIFSQGYWTELGFEQALIKSSVEDYIYRGFVMLANALANTFGGSDRYLVWGSAFLVITVFVVGLLIRVAARKIRRKLRLKEIKRRRLNSGRRMKSNAFEREADDAMRLTQAIANMLLAFFFFSAIFMTLIILATKQGEYAAQRTLAKLASGNTAFPVIEVLIGDRTWVGRVIQCSDVWCAVYINGQAIPAKVDDLKWLVEVPSAGVDNGIVQDRTTGKP